MKHLMTYVDDYHWLRLWFFTDRIKQAPIRPMIIKEEQLTYVYALLTKNNKCLKYGHIYWFRR